MKTNKSFLILLLAWMLLLGACQPQATEPPAAMIPATGADAPSPEATNPPAATEAPQAEQSALTASLSELTGTVELKQDAQGAFTPARVDMRLEVNGQVQTGVDGKARLDLSSGTIIRVAPSSLFTLVSNEPAEDGGLLTKLRMELGMIFIILNGGQAEVETPAGLAAVRGSYMMANYDPETKQLTLTCLEGNCAFKTPDGEWKEFTDSQKIIISQSEDGQWIVTGEGFMEPVDFETWLSFNPEAEELVRQAMGGDLPGGSSAGGGGGACAVTLTAPLGNIPLGANPFEWDPVEGAASYVLTFTPERGEPFSFTVQAPNTSKDVDLSAILRAGSSVSWSVSALDGNNTPFCTSVPSSLTVPVPEIREKEEEEEEPEEAPPPTQPPYYGFIMPPIAMAASPWA